MPVWLWVVGAIVAAVVAVIGLGLIFSWGAFDDQRDKGYDSDAKANVRTVQTAIETYAIDSGGSFEGATIDELSAIESSIADMPPVSVETTADSYSLSTESESGIEFSLSRSEDGTITYSCSEPGNGGCEADGTWGGPVGMTLPGGTFAFVGPAGS